jgi:hypothetical protein
VRQVAVLAARCGEGDARGIRRLRRVVVVQAGVDGDTVVVACCLPVRGDVRRRSDVVCRVVELVEVLDEPTHHVLDTKLVAVGDAEVSDDRFGTPAPRTHRVGELG